MAIQNEERAAGQDKNAGLKQRLQQQTEQLRTARTGQQQKVGLPVTAQSPGTPSVAAAEQRDVQGGPGLVDRAINVGRGVAQIGAGLVTAIPAAAIDHGRQAIAAATDSSLSPEQKSFARDRMGGGLIVRGVDNIGEGFDGTKNALAEAIGATPSALSASSSAQSTNAAAKLPAALTPAPSTPLPSESEHAQSPAQNSELAKGGSGSGTFSQMQEGDSARSMAVFDKANSIRGETLRAQGGLRVSAIGAGPDAMDRAKERREMNIAGGLRNMSQSTLRDMSRNQQDSAMGAAELGLRRQQLAQSADSNASRQALEQVQVAEAKQGIRLADMDVKSKERIDQLAKVIGDPNATEEQRSAAFQAYSALTTQPKDRYVLQDEQIGVDAMGTPKYGKAAYDVTTGSRLGQGQAQASQQPGSQYKEGKIYKDGAGNRARYAGVDQGGNPVWEDV